MKNGTIITIKNLKKDFGTRTIIDIEHQDFKSGKVYVIHGKNGSGKTTLLRLIAGLEELSGGQIINHTAVRERGFCLYNPYLFMGSVEYNIGWGLRLRGVRQKEIVRAVGESAERFCIDHILTRDVKNLSAGESRKTALARAAILSPGLMLLDEPSSNLDKKGLECLRNEFGRIISRNGTCILTTNLYPFSELGTKTDMILDECGLKKLETYTGCKSDERR